MVYLRRRTMSTEFPGSTQKELLSEKASLSAKYSTLVVGRRSLGKLLRFEVINLLFSGVPGAFGLALRKAFFPFLFRKVGKGVVFGRNITLRHPHKIVIGDNCVLDDNVVLDAKGEKNEGLRLGDNVYIGRNTILSCKEGSITIGDYTNIAANCSLLAETEITLGQYCFLAGHCFLVAGGNHSFNDVSRPIMFQPSVSKGGIRLGDDVWLGAGVIVLDGASIGRGAVVGAGSVVTGSLPEYAVAVASRRLVITDRRTNK
jgi:acetyltransferase-like isoleucine patch superfamily enzyme